MCNLLQSAGAYNFQLRRQWDALRPRTEKVCANFVQRLYFGRTEIKQLSSEWAALTRDPYALESKNEQLALEVQSMPSLAFEVKNNE